jgi:outer membrane usher protein
MTNWMSLKAFACLNVLIFLLLLSLSSARGEETIILNIIANNENKGTFFVIMEDTGDFLLRLEDLKQVGFIDPAGTVYEIDNELYMSLFSIEGVTFEFNEKEIALELTAMPFLFQKSVLDLQPPRRPQVLLPRDTSAFLNYALNYTLIDSSQREIDISTQLGARHHDFLFLSDAFYTDDRTTNKLVRLMSNMTYDQRNDSKRFVFGDLSASSGGLGNTLLLGGFSYQKIFLMDPHFIQHPTSTYTGSVSFPSKMDVYLDGMLIKRLDVSPGEFDLNNVTTRNGAGLTELVITDPFGKEQRLAYSFYQDSNLLKTGLHEYTYNIGFLREAFGEKSFQYGDLVLSGFHRYGINDSITADIRGEASRQSSTFGPSASLLIGNLGVITSSFAGSLTEDNNFGSSAALGYRFESRRFSARFEGRRFSRAYTTLTTQATEKDKKHEVNARIGYNLMYVGSLNTAYSITTHYEGESLQVATIGYSRHVFRNLSFYARFQWRKETDTTREIAMLLSYSPGYLTSLTTSYQHTDGTNTESVQIRKNPSLGEGFSGRAFYEKEDSVQILEGLFQYDARFGTYTGRYRSVDGDPIYEASASGAMAYVNNAFGVTRSIRDSFAVVEIGDVEGVRVYRNSQEIGRTDSKGRVFLPDIGSFFDNHLSIEDQDIPIDHMIPVMDKTISPPLRSGSHVAFEARKFQAIVGKIGVRADGKMQPVEFYAVRMMVDGEEMTFTTGREGEYYAEGVQPGTYKASIDFMEKPCSFAIIVPEVDDVIIDLGEFSCEPTP